MTRLTEDAGRDDPVLLRIRSRRQALGISFHALSRISGISAPHLFHIERGRKIPSVEYAVRLARALDDDIALYRTWAQAMARRRNTVEARDALIRLMADLRRLGEGAADSAAESPGAARVIVPVVAAGADPDDASSRTGELRVGAGRIGEARLERPFAYRLTPEFAARVRDVLPGAGHAVVSRAPGRPDASRAYAVRHAGAVRLSRLWWNRRQLVLLPADADGDLVVVALAEPQELVRHVLGVVALVVPEAEAP